MERLERFYKIDQLLKDRRVVSFATLMEKLGISRASVKRDLEVMRSRFNPADGQLYVGSIDRTRANRAALHALGADLRHRVLAEGVGATRAMAESTVAASSFDR